MSAHVIARQKFRVLFGDRNDCGSYDQPWEPVGLSIGVGLVPRPYADFARVNCELVRASVVDRGGGPDRKAERKECQGNRFELHFLIIGERKIPGANCSRAFR